MLPGQLNLFDSPASPAPATTESAEPVHWLVVTTKRARTACGILTYGISTDTAIAAETGNAFRYTMDFYSGKVTCPRCREAI